MEASEYFTTTTCAIVRLQLLQKIVERPNANWK